jgi:GGDEF domain-containing protein
MVRRACELAGDHDMRSVFVGIAGAEGDLLATEFLEFVESALRIEDRIFRLLRERAVVLLADIDEDGARRVLDRLRTDFTGRYAPGTSLDVSLGFHEVDPAGPSPTAKDVLPQLFGGGARQDDRS